jgi:hypothetical protein
MPRTPISDAINAYSAASGLSRRSAQLHAQQSNPKWLEFFKGYSTDSVASQVTEAMIPPKNAEILHFSEAQSHIAPASASAPQCIPPAALMKPVFERLPCEQNLVDTWDQLNEITARMKGKVDLITYVGCAERRIKLVQAYNACEREVIRVLSASNNLVPVSVFGGVIALVQRYADLLLSLPTLADRVNPEAPEVARAELDRWLNDRIAPASAAITEQCDDILRLAGKKIVSMEDPQWGNYAA